MDFSDPTISEDEVETRHLMMDGANVGLVKAYKATEEEAKIMKSRMKKKVKPGQTFSVKVFLDRELDDRSLEAVAEGVRSTYSDLTGRVYFVLNTRDGFVPLRMW